MSSGMDVSSEALFCSTLCIFSGTIVSHFLSCWALLQLKLLFFEKFRVRLGPWDYQPFWPCLAEIFPSCLERKDVWSVAAIFISIKAVHKYCTLLLFGTLRMSLRKTPSDQGVYDNLTRIRPQLYRHMKLEKIFQEKFVMWLWHTTVPKHLSGLLKCIVWRQRITTIRCSKSSLALLYPPKTLEKI